MNDGTRYLIPETIKATFGSIKDFETYWLKKNQEFVEKYPQIGTPEEAIEVTNKTVKEIASEFKEGDEIIHFDDFGFAMEKCEREYVLIRRSKKVVKAVLIRMS
jgi:hypothetical protein